MRGVGQKCQQRGREVNILLARLSTTMFTEQTKTDIKMNQVRMDQSWGKTNQVRMDQSSGKTNLSELKQRAINQVHEVVEGLHNMNKAANLIEVNAVVEDGNTRAFFDAKTRWFGIQNNEELDEQKDKREEELSIVTEIFVCVKSMVQDTWIMQREAGEQTKQVVFNRKRLEFEHRDVEHSTSTQKDEHRDVEQSATQKVEHPDVEHSTLSLVMENWAMHKEAGEQTKQVVINRKRLGVEHRDVGPSSSSQEGEHRDVEHSRHSTFQEGEHRDDEQIAQGSTS
jgi:hypothetical protein